MSDQLLDMAGLRRYDERIKGYVDDKALNPSGWGVAKIGAVSLSSATAATVDISDLGFMSADDYEVLTSLNDSGTTAVTARVYNKTTTSFTIRKTSSGSNIPVTYVVVGKGYGGGSTIRDLILDTAMSDTSENGVENRVIKKYVDDMALVDAAFDAASERAVQNKVVTAKVNDLQFQIGNLGEPFRVKSWADATLDVTIPTCASDMANTSIQKMEFSISDEEGADYQIVGMIAYEVFDATSTRINCWPVCQFTGNGQKTLTVRWMCGGTANKVAKRIAAWVLLKHR